LATATLAAQAHADVELPMGQVRPLSCFFLSVAASGERKSSCDNEALKPVRKHEAELHRDYETLRTIWENDFAVWEKQRSIILGDKKADSFAKRADLEALGAKPKEPLLPLQICPEPTFEGLCKMFAVGQPSIGVFSSEGGQFIGGHGMSDENKLKTAAGLSTLWDGEAIRRVRSGDGASRLPGRRTSMHLMAQPDVAAKLLSDRVLSDQGLLSRFLIVAPESLAGTRFFREATDKSKADFRVYEETIRRILETPPPTAEDKPNELDPYVLQLSPEANEMWKAYADHVESEIARDGSYEPIKGLANKLPEHAARLAGVLSLVNNLEAKTISPESMANGINLTKYYASEALRLFAVSAADINLVLAERLLDWMRGRQRNVFSLTDIYQYGPNGIREAKLARKIAEILQDHGYLSKIKDGAVIDGCPRKEVWRLVDSRGVE
jgi:hypothetical protein